MDIAKVNDLVEDTLDKVATHCQWLGTNCAVVVSQFEQVQEGNAMVHAAILRLQKKGKAGTKLKDFKADKEVAPLLKGAQDGVKRFTIKQAECVTEGKKTAQFVKLLKMVDAQVVAAAKDPANARNPTAIKSLQEMMKTIQMCEQGLDDVPPVPGVEAKDIALTDNSTIKEIASKADVKYKIDLDKIKRLQKQVLTGADQVSALIKQQIADTSKALNR